jgi:hypothetical protein
VGVTSLYQRTFGEVLDDSVTRDLLNASMTEIATLADACGVPLGADAVTRAMATATAFPPAARTSMQRDFAEGRPTELEAFSGACCGWLSVTVSMCRLTEPSTMGYNRVRRTGRSNSNAADKRGCIWVRVRAEIWSKAVRLP